MQLTDFDSTVWSWDAPLTTKLAGADAVQIYTGLIYKGPALVDEAARALRQHPRQA